ncbi:CRISPR-associated ring nuclease Crn3/Csx3 [Synechococcus sp. W55.1]|uniref:CRISPR-associated ring nuclease Crn3/Csx3 n=1 Tax=Synechococcus sp. W55.1 TaxID=2964512 RepID=UPI0039C1DC48
MAAVALHLLSGCLAEDPRRSHSSELSFQVIEIELTRPDRLVFPEDLAQLRLPAGIDARLGVVLTGRAPIWLYGWLVHECHFTRWVACYDPRLGAVVVSSHTPEVRVGQVIPWVQGRPGSELAAAVMVVGPPDSGKSRLARALFEALLPEHPDIYLQRAHWDGEGNWTLDLPLEQAEALKQRYRGRSTPEFFGFHAQAILALRRQKSLVIVDVGGKVDPQKQPILEACSHYLVVSRDPEAIPLWHEFCRDRGNLRCVAILHTSPGPPQVLKDSPELEIRWDPNSPPPAELLRAVRRLIA